MAPSLSVTRVDKIELLKTQFDTFTTLTILLHEKGVPVATVVCYAQNPALEIITLESHDVRSTTHEQAAT